jgi:dihydroorotase
METLTITQPDDWHIHLRDGQALTRTVPDAAAQFNRAIVMPNLTPPVTDIAMAEAYRQRILTHIPEGVDFTPLMSLYLTDTMSVDTLKQAAAHPNIYAVKLYPAGATTNSAAGVTNILGLYPQFEAMQAHGLPLLIHGEVTYGDIFDREAIFVNEILSPLREDFPELKIVLEHITTSEARDFVLAQSSHVAATITPHHLLYDRNQLLAGGLKPDYYCLPILKRVEHQQALMAAATSGDPRFFLGTDSAPHTSSTKYAACGCAGIYNAYSAIELYAQAFAQVNALSKLEAFASFHGPDFYGLPRNGTSITLTQQDWVVPEQLSFAGSQLTPLYAGQTLIWKRQ